MAFRRNRVSRVLPDGHGPSTDVEGQGSPLSGPHARARALEGRCPRLPSVSREAWNDRLDGCDVSRELLNKVVMNLLVVEGYQDVATEFQSETGTQPEVPLESIKQRMEIRKTIQSGDVERVVEQVNALNPRIFENDTRLLFHLQQQHLIELIREDKVAEALSFAQEEVAPRAGNNAEFLVELERTMMLLVFKGHDGRAGSTGADLLGAQQRQKVAGELNEAILNSQCQMKHPRLCWLLKHLNCTQSALAKQVTFPAVDDLISAGLTDPAANRPDENSGGAARRHLHSCSESDEY